LKSSTPFAGKIQSPHPVFILLQPQVQTVHLHVGFCGRGSLSTVTRYDGLSGAL